MDQIRSANSEKDRKAAVALAGVVVEAMVQSRPDGERTTRVPHPTLGTVN
jgi:hypothetical protein